MTYDLCQNSSTAALSNGNTYTLLFERLMKHPHIMEQIMSLDVVKKLLKDAELLKSVVKGGQGIYS